VCRLDKIIIGESESSHPIPWVSPHHHKNQSSTFLNSCLDKSRHTHDRIGLGEISSGPMVALGIERRESPTISSCMVSSEALIRSLYHIRQCAGIIILDKALHDTIVRYYCCSLFD